jgi:transcriptional regulator with XRE-family HTH domain
MSERPSNTGMGFGDKLRSLRERAGFTQEELAELAGLTPHAISALERGTRTRPYPRTVRSLADALDLSEAERTALIRLSAQAPYGGDRRGTPNLTGPFGSTCWETSRFRRSTHAALWARQRRRRSVAFGPIRKYAAYHADRPRRGGKTRLAIEVGEQLAQDYPDGVLPIALSGTCRCE